MSLNINELNKQFQIPGQIEFVEGKGKLINVKITNKKASALISLYGAHLMSFIPKDQPDLMWMSNNSMFEIGKPIRGGIPVCFPWFGPHATDKTKPLHGFVRIMYWDVIEVKALSEGETFIKLGIASNDETIAIWPSSFKAEISFTISSKLEVTLNYKNTGTEPMVCTDALHPYFNISNISNINISGLKGAQYLAGITAQTPIIQEDELLPIKQEENRRYLKHTNDCVIDDSGFHRKIRIAKKGSNTTVVWNPWIETSKGMVDIHEEGYKTFVCVEPTNAFNDIITLQSGQSHSLSAIVTIES